MRMYWKYMNMRTYMNISIFAGEKEAPHLRGFNSTRLGNVPNPCFKHLWRAILNSILESWISSPTDSSMINLIAKIARL